MKKEKAPVKISVRFYNNREVRAVWDNRKHQWWFAAADVIGAITESSNPRKYWSVLKTRLKKSDSELTTNCSQLKLTASDGKKYATDCFMQSDVLKLAKVIPSKNVQGFLDWFVFSENTIDGQSRKKAYKLIESNLVSEKDIGTVKALQQIHAFIFGGLYSFAGKIRTKTIAKGDTIFCLAEHLQSNLQTIEKMPETTFAEIVDKYVEMNMAHPFMEGNGRSTRIWLDLILKKRLGKCVDWSKIGKADYLNAMIESHFDTAKISDLLKQALTDRIADRELFMKGIDYSYYYEQED